MVDAPPQRASPSRIIRHHGERGSGRLRRPEHDVVPAITLRRAYASSFTAPRLRELRGFGGLTTTTLGGTNVIRLAVPCDHRDPLIEKPVGHG
jgi:hypothetical protein